MRATIRPGVSPIRSGIQPAPASADTCGGIHYYADALDQAGTRDEPRPEEWELFDLQTDPYELLSLHDDPAHAGLLAELQAELDRLVDEVGDVDPARDPRRYSARQQEAAS